MRKIFEQIELATIIETLSDKTRRVVVAGGCFDLLHPGHHAFLKAAKKAGDILLILLESDQAIKKLKGDRRPIQNQQVRATMLSQLPYPDYILLLKNALTDKEYDELILAIKPAIIATTEGDPGEYHKKRQAEISGAVLMKVIKRLPEFSTSNFVNKV